MSIYKCAFLVSATLLPCMGHAALYEYRLSGLMSPRNTTALGLLTAADSIPRDSANRVAFTATLIVDSSVAPTVMTDTADLQEFAYPGSIIDAHISFGGFPVGLIRPLETSESDAQVLNSTHPSGIDRAVFGVADTTSWPGYVGPLGSLFNAHTLPWGDTVGGVFYESITFRGSALTLFFQGAGNLSSPAIPTNAAALAAAAIRTFEFESLITTVPAGSGPPPTARFGALSDFTIHVSPVPEPEGMALWLAGLGVIAALVRRRMSR